MGSIQFRDFQKKDAQRLAELCAEAWPIFSTILKTENVPKMMESYVLISRIGSTWLDLATINDEIVGFLFGNLKAERTLIDIVKSIFLSLHLSLGFIVGRYGKLTEPLVFFRKAFATERKLEKYTPKASGEIMLFVVDAKQRGKGIGRALLNRFIARAKAVDAKLISVYTDPLSNWKFYEKVGFERQATFIDNLNSYMAKTETEGFVYTISP